MVWESHFSENCGAGVSEPVCYQIIIFLLLSFSSFRKNFLPPQDLSSEKYVLIKEQNVSAALYLPLRTKYCRNWWHIIIIIIIIISCYCYFYAALTIEQDLVRCQRSLAYSLLQRVSVVSRWCCKFLYLPIPKKSSNNTVLTGNFLRYFNPESVSFGNLLHQSSTENRF